MNSSINLLDSFASLKWTPIGFAFESKSNFNSVLSKEIAPSLCRWARSFLANWSNFKIASTTLFSLIYDERDLRKSCPSTRRWFPLQEITKVPARIDHT